MLKNIIGLLYRFNKKYKHIIACYVITVKVWEACFKGGVMNEKLIRDLVDQAKDYEQYLLTAALAVLSKGVNEYLLENPREDATMFNEVFSSGNSS